MNRGADFEPKSCNRKLAPVGTTPGRVRPHFVAMPPFVSTTSVSIETTCPESCVFKGMPGLPGGCYADAGFTRIKGEALDEGARHLTADEVVAEEARLILGSFSGGWIPRDGARGGRDLRLHIGGDVGSEAGARDLAIAAGAWRLRGGGAIWTFTHRWREVARAAWGTDISVLASIESPTDIAKAWARGYAAAFVVERLPADGKAFVLPGIEGKIVPCPAETRGTNCASCRLCMRDQSLLNKTTIAFGVHGQQSEQARQALRATTRVTRATAEPRSSQ